MSEMNLQRPASHPWHQAKQRKFDRENKVNVDPISIADERITLGPTVGRFTHDYKNGRLAQDDFMVVYYLAENADREVPYSELIKELYGFTLGNMEKEFLRRFHFSLSNFRVQLGEELADKDYGAIRTIHNMGYIAVKHL